MAKSRGYTVQVHFNRQCATLGLPWTVHYRGQCIPAKRVVFNTPTETVYQPEKRTNPRAWIKCVRAVVTLDFNNVAIVDKVSINVQE